MNLGISAQSVQSLISKSNWANIYCDEFQKRLNDLKNCSFPEKYFYNSILDLLKNSYENEQIRSILQKWMLIADYKAQTLIMILSLIPEQHKKFEDIRKEYKEVPLGPQEASIIDKMSEQDRQAWHEGNIAISFTATSQINLFSLFVSELFFSAEAYCRAICIGSCLEFAHKALTPTVTTQHDEVYKALKKLGDKKGDNIACKICMSKNICKKNESYQKLSAMYELLYHLRTIKDYKLEFYFDKDFISFLIQQVIPNGIIVLSAFDETKRKIFLNYLNSPFSLSELYKKINNVT